MSAKDTLLRALENIEQAEQEVNSEVRHVAVVYSVTKREDGGLIHEAGGWSHSDDPDWLIAALLRRAADAIEDCTSVDPDGDE